MPHDEVIGALEQSGLWIGPRPVLEDDVHFRQIIPYIILRKDDEFVQYTRTPSGGEERLHGRISIGLGGHIDLVDMQTDTDKVNLHRTVEVAAQRELQEELGNIEFLRKEWVGLLVEHDSDVGRVHIGLVGIWTLSEGLTGEFEHAIGNVKFSSIDELWLEQDRMETWSLYMLPWLAAEAPC